MKIIPRLSKVALVRHAVDTTEDEPEGGGSWINYWVEHTRLLLPSSYEAHSYTSMGSSSKSSPCSTMLLPIVA